MRKRRLRLLALLSLLVAGASAYGALHIDWLDPCALEDEACLRRPRIGGAVAVDVTIAALTAAVWCAVRALRRQR